MSHQFVGEEHDVGISIFFVTAPPGRRVRPHRHNYDEIIVVQEGRTLCQAGDERRTAGAGDITSIPAGTPHSFTNIGDTPLRQIDIHASVRFLTEWLEEQ